MQYFKGDATEVKFYNAGKTIFDLTSTSLSDFFTHAYDASPLADVIYLNDRSPLTNAIVQDIFRTSFAQIFDAFVVAGSFESYLTVFQKIFGAAADITFTVPGAGRLNIDIEATEVELSPFVARIIVDNLYEYDPVLTQAGDQLVFQTIQGFTSQYELEKMLFEMVPAGVFTTITLTIGS